MVPFRRLMIPVGSPVFQVTMCLGTVVIFKPGVLVGGEFSFECCQERGLGYFVEFLLLVAPFCKLALNCHLSGSTNSVFDPSIDMIKQAWLPVYRSLIGACAAADLKLEIVNRGVPPNGGGLILLSTKPSTFVLPIVRLQFGKVFRIRGVAWTCRVNSGYGHKMILAAKSILNQFLSDVYITTDHRKGDSAGLSPGFGLTLWAETKEGTVYSAESTSETAGSSNEPVDGEAVGRNAANRLLSQVLHAGCVDSGAQSLTLLLMAAEGGRNVSRLAIGPLTPYTVETLRLIKAILGVTFDFSYRSKLSRISSATAVVEEGQRNAGAGQVGSRLEEHQAAAPAGDVGPGSDPVSDLGSGPDSDVLVATCFGAGLQNVVRVVR